MSTTYPTSKQSFTSHTDNTASDLMDSADINDPQDTVAALEDAVGYGSTAGVSPAGILVPNTKKYAHKNAAGTTDASISEDASDNLIVNVATGKKVSFTVNSVEKSYLDTNGIGGAFFAQTLGYAQITSNDNTGSASNSNTPVDISGLSITLTMPSGGRYAEITAYARVYNQSTAATLTVYLYEGATLLGKSSIASPAANTVVSPVVFKIATVSAASHTYKVAVSTSGLVGGINVEADATFPAFIHAKLV